jgi:hypothetical protein
VAEILVEIDTSIDRVTDCLAFCFHTINTLVSCHGNGEI